jgi:hypothetical protein
MEAQRIRGRSLVTLFGSYFKKEFKEINRQQKLKIKNNLQL